MAETRTFIWAHRGASGHEVDNTLESFELAIEMGADGIESDVHVSKDNVLVFYHDDKVKWNGGEISPSKLTIAELLSIDLGNGRRIPLVSDIFEHFKDKKNKYGNPISYSLDVKRINMAIPLAQIAKDIEVSENVELTLNDNYPSFWGWVKKIRDINNEIVIVNSAKLDMLKLRRIFKKLYYQKWENYKKYSLKAINLKADHVDDRVIKEIKNQGLKMYVWDCHTDEVCKKFMEKNVDAIYSNYPDNAVAIRNQLK